MEIPQPHSSLIRNFYFCTGVVATIAYRIIVVFNYISPSWVQATWYVGTVGFILYFLHRWEISHRRSRVINQLHLSEKIKNGLVLDETDKRAMSYVFTTLGSSKETWNYVIIFVSSAAALLIGIYLDFLRP